jgi:hypothetical protein
MSNEAYQMATIGSLRKPPSINSGGVEMLNFIGNTYRVAGRFIQNVLHLKKMIACNWT